MTESEDGDEWVRRLANQRRNLREGADQDQKRLAGIEPPFATRGEAFWQTLVDELGRLVGVYNSQSEQDQQAVLEPSGSAVVIRSKVGKVTVWFEPRAQSIRVEHVIRRVDARRIYRVVPDRDTLIVELFAEPRHFGREILEPLLTAGI